MIAFATVVLIFALVTCPLMGIMFNLQLIREALQRWEKKR